MIAYVESPKESNKATRMSEFSKTNHINTHDNQSVSCSVMSDCHPMDCRFLCPGDFLGKNTGVSIPFSKGSSWPRDWTRVSCIAGRFFTIWAPQGSPYKYV